MKLFRQSHSNLILQITHFALRARTLIMEKTRRNAYDAAFKLKAISLAVEEGNRAASRTFGINESMVRRWRRQHEQLTRCKKTTKAFRGKKSRWPELENVLEDWANTQRADGRGVSTVQIRLKAKTIATEQNIEDFGVSDLCNEKACQLGHGRLCVSSSLPTSKKK